MDAPTIVLTSLLIFSMLERYGESGQPYLVPDLSVITLSFSPFNLMLVVSLLYITFIIFRYVPCIPDLSKTFIIKGCWILSNAVSAPNEMIMFFFFQFIYMIDYIDRFLYVEPALHLWDDAHLIMVDNFFMCHGISCFLY